MKQGRARGRGLALLASVLERYTYQPFLFGSPAARPACDDRAEHLPVDVCGVRRHSAAVLVRTDAVADVQRLGIDHAVVAQHQLLGSKSAALEPLTHDLGLDANLAIRLPGAGIDRDGDRPIARPAHPHLLGQPVGSGPQLDGKAVVAEDDIACSAVLVCRALAHQHVCRREAGGVAGGDSRLRARSGGADDEPYCGGTDGTTKSRHGFSFLIGCLYKRCNSPEGLNPTSELVILYYKLILKSILM
jgi:hypothetical protein